ncbi:MAG: fimbrillin family protein [Bacteroidales bacterium]|nr:fimbrillin family protein [Bacteroidales bacterium]
MKKKTYLICTAALVAAFGFQGCNQEESTAPENEIQISVLPASAATRADVAGDRQMALTFLSEDGNTALCAAGSVSSLPDVADPATKGVPYTTTGLTQFGVDAYLTTEVTGVATHYIDNGQADKTDAGWTLSNPTDQTGYKWVHNQTISFWAHAPYNWLEAVSGAAYQLSNVAVASDYASLSFDYTSSSLTIAEAADADKAAPDILIAHTAASSMNGKVNFSFGHVFSGIRFDIAESLSANYDLVAIDLLNIAGDGTCTVAADGTVTWGESTGTINLRQELTGTGFVFFVRPQTLGTDAKVTVMLNSKTAPVTTLQVTASLAGMELKNGELNAFNVGFYAAGFSDFPVGHANAEPWDLGEYEAHFWQEGEGNVTFWMDNFGDTPGNFSNNLEFEMIDGALVAKSQILEESQNQFCLATGYIAGLNGGDFNNGWLKTQGVPFMRLVRTGENSIKFIPETYTLNGTTYTFQKFGVTKRDGSQVKGTPLDLPLVAGPDN